jgi:hypothetical protein
MRSYIYTNLLFVVMSLTRPLNPSQRCSAPSVPSRPPPGPTVRPLAPSPTRHLRLVLLFPDAEQMRGIRPLGPATLHAMVTCRLRAARRPSCTEEKAWRPADLRSRRGAEEMVERSKPAGRPPVRARLEELAGVGGGGAPWGCARRAPA